MRSWLCGVALLGLAACQSLSTKLCGTENHACCEASKCEAGLVCGEGQTCIACGTESAACCEGASCGSGLSCSGGTCARCGVDGAACCPGSNACGAGLKCVQGTCGCSGACTPGTQRCSSGNGVEACQGATDSCPAWATVLGSCPSGQTCLADAGTAACAEDCPGACAVGSFLCTTVGARKCEKATGVKCPAYVNAASGEGPPCSLGACTTSGFCWESPVPFGEDIAKLSGWAEDQLFVLDVLGNVLRLDGVAWSYELRSTINQRPRALASCLISGRMAVAGDRGLVMRRVTGGWVTEPAPGTPDWGAVACDPVGRVVVAGQGGAVAVRSDTGSWLALDAGTATGFQGLAYYPFQGAAYALGPAGTIVRCAPVYDAPTATCAREAAGLTTESLVAGWSEVTGAVDRSYAVGGQGTVLERKNGGWDRFDAGLGTLALSGVHGNTTQVFVAGAQGAFADRSTFRYWPQSFTTGDLTDVFASGDTLNDPVFAAGRGGALWRNPYGGVEPSGVNNWTQVGGAGPILDDLRALHGLGSDDVYAVGRQGAVFHRSDQAWRREAQGQTADFFAVLAVSPTEVYAVGSGGTILARRGTTWAHEGEGVTSAALLGLATDGTTVFAVGSQGAWLEKPVGGPGSSWALKPSGSAVDLFALTLVGAEVVAVGADTTVVSEKQGSFSSQQVPGGNGRALLAAATSGGLLFVAGEEGFASQRASSGNWSREYPGATLENFLSAAARGSELWVGASAGQLYRRSGASWAQVEPALTTTSFQGVWLGPTGDVYLVGSGGRVLHRP